MSYASRFGCLVALPLSLSTGCGPAGVDLDYRDGQQRPTIVNGTRAPQNTFLTPGEILAIGYLADGTGDNFCSGTLTAARLVVTARHCVVGTSETSVFFGFGEDPADPVAVLPVVEILRHPDIDFALLILGQNALDLVPGVEPIAFNRDPFEATWVDRWVDAAGFGATYADTTGRFFGSVQIAEYDSETVTVDGHGLQGICYGDSGGPIIYQPDAGTAPLVLGTEQWGDASCVDRDHLTRLDVVAPWIDDQLAAGYPPELGPCGGLDYFGECTEAGVVRWCGGGYLRQEDCATAGEGCGWGGSQIGYSCLPAECGGIDYRGECDGSTLRYCRTDTGLNSRDCTSYSQSCIWIDNITGYNCGDCIRCGGECTDLATSLAHCGACDNPCGAPNAVAICDDGECSITGCAPGFLDEDGDITTGCEGQVEAAPRGKKKDDGCAATPADLPNAALVALGLLASRRRRRA